MTLNGLVAAVKGSVKDGTRLCCMQKEANQAILSEVRIINIAYAFGISFDRIVLSYVMHCGLSIIPLQES